MNDFEPSSRPERFPARKHATVWGVDVGLNTTTIAALGAERLRFARPTPTDGAIEARLGRLFTELQERAHELCLELPPLCVVMERPTGRFIRPHLYYAAGVVMTALSLVLNDGRFPHPVSVFQASPTEWKKATVGKGNATKHDVLAWALEHRLAPPILTQDEADALAIAEFARRSVR